MLLLEDVGSGPEGVVDDPVVDRSEQLVRRFEQGEVPRVAGEDWRVLLDRMDCQYPKNQTVS